MDASPPYWRKSRLFHCLCECDFRAYAFCACLVIIHLAERLDGVRPALGQRFRRVRLAGVVEVIHHVLHCHRTAAHDRILPVRDRFFCPGRSICCAVLCSVFCCPGICPALSLRDWVSSSAAFTAFSKDRRARPRRARPPEGLQVLLPYTISGVFSPLSYSPPFSCPVPYLSFITQKYAGKQTKS